MTNAPTKLLQGLFGGLSMTSAMSLQAITIDSSNIQPFFIVMVVAC